MAGEGGGLLPPVPAAQTRKRRLAPVSCDVREWGQVKTTRQEAQADEKVAGWHDFKREEFEALRLELGPLADASSVHSGARPGAAADASSVPSGARPGAAAGRRQKRDEPLEITDPELLCPEWPEGYADEGLFLIATKRARPEVEQRKGFHSWDLLKHP